MISTFFGRNLKYLIDQSGKTNKSVANHLGFSHSSITNWTKGKSHPAVKDLIEICNYFEVSIDEMLKSDLSQTYTSPTHSRQKAPEPEAESIGKMYKLLERYVVVLENAIRQDCPKLKEKLRL